MKISAPLRVAAIVIVLARPSTAGKNPNLTRLNAEYAYLLPHPFYENLTRPFVTGTTVEDQNVASSLQHAAGSLFVSYTQEFDDLVADATMELVSDAPFPFSWAGGGGTWLPDLNQIWHTSLLYNGAMDIYITHLDNNTSVRPTFVAAPGYQVYLPLPNPAGAYYFNSTVYVCLTGNEHEPPGLVGINPRTLEVTPLVNSYFGLELPSLDDVTVTYTRTDQGFQTNIFFTTIDLKSSFDLDIGRPEPVLPNAVWKFTPEKKKLQPIIPRSDVYGPNGIAVDREFKHLYVTDTVATSRAGGGGRWNVTSSPAIYRYDLLDDGMVSNKALFGITRAGVSDGIKVDDKGRVWTAEYEGIVVRNHEGDVLGFFNREVILEHIGRQAEMTQFAIAGDTLILLALDRVLKVRLNETIVRPEKHFLPPQTKDEMWDDL